MDGLRNKIETAKRTQEESRKQRDEEHLRKVEELKKKNEDLKDLLESKLSVNAKTKAKNRSKK